MPKEISFTIKGGIPSKKNRHIIKKNHRTGINYIGSDDVYHLWEVQHASELEHLTRTIGSFAGCKDIHIEYEFRVAHNKDGTPCKKRWDISNKIESINDMMVKAGIIDDDCHTVLRSMNARVIDSSVEESEVAITLIEIRPTS